MVQVHYLLALIMELALAVLVAEQAVVMLLMVLQEEILDSQG